MVSFDKKTLELKIKDLLGELSDTTDKKRTNEIMCTYLCLDRQYEVMTGHRYLSKSQKGGRK